MADEEDWLPGADLQAACKELRDVKAWLAAVSPPQSTKKQASKVSEADQVEHILAGGQWEGLGAVCKGAEIHIEVHPRQLRIGNRGY